MMKVISILGSTVSRPLYLMMESGSLRVTPGIARRIPSERGRCPVPEVAKTSHSLFFLRKISAFLRLSVREER